ncbi:MAG: prepilin-type N-terminal cleavage/methylation domain-containing protein [Deltaproteobacteria bacterium]|nr:prepilin-type N-terminal cleavage/methylation domain-containing protein [Deltaproteobacteria bacterium]
MRRTRAGFTLVELIVTIAILGVLGLLTVPQLFANLPRFRVNGAAKMLAGELQLTRMKAVSTNRIHYLTFDLTAQTVTIAEDAGGGGRTTLKTVSLASTFPGAVFGYNSVPAPSGSGTISAAVAFGSGAGTEITFLPNGLLRESGAIYLIPSVDLGTANNDRMRALLVSLAGQVSLRRYKGSASPPWEEY